jgi:hypothetical protein
MLHKALWGQHAFAEDSVCLNVHGRVEMFLPIAMHQASAPLYLQKKARLHQCLIPRKQPAHS